MARKSKTRSNRTTDSGEAGQAIRDSAQKIWLAGLGAFERARTDGPRMFETLVEQGRNMGARAVGAADEALKSVRESGFSLGEVVRQMAAGTKGPSAGKRGTAKAATRGTAKAGTRAKAGTKAKATRTRKAAAGSTARRTSAKGTGARRKRAAAS
jgi:hypothetical protein